MRVLYISTSGGGDATKVSLPWHLAVNGSVEAGQQPTIMLAGDAAELLSGDAAATLEGVGVPPLRELVAKAREHEVPVFV